MKKRKLSRRSELKAVLPPFREEWHNGADVEIHLYARSLRTAAKILLERSDWIDDASSAWDVGPIVLLYRQATELHLKAVVGNGCNFLSSPTDHITLYTTHSTRWLTQIVCQIIRAARWESEFNCAGVTTLAEFRALIDHLESLDPVSCAVYADKSGQLGELPSQLRRSKVADLFPKLDALLDLLAATADGLAAEWDLRALAQSRIEIKPSVQ